MNNENWDLLIDSIESLNSNNINYNDIEQYGENNYNPSLSSENEANLLKSLGLPTVTSKSILEVPLSINDEYKNLRLKQSSPSNFLEGVNISSWKLIENVSSKLISFDCNSVLLECLIDREESIYEEREFVISLFKNYSLEIGKLFKICVYERDNQIMIEVKVDPNLILDSDFPEIDLFAKYSHINLGKRID